MATRLWRAALHPAAPFGKSSPLDLHRDATQPALRDAPIQTGAAIRSHAALEPMTYFGVLVHSSICTVLLIRARRLP